MKVSNNILETIGNTPMVKLNKITSEVEAKVYAKLEYFNPGASVKDRMAVKMVEDAEKSGYLKPGGTIAFSTWPPELFMGQFFQIISKYNPPLSSDFSPPHLWGNVDVVIKRLENSVYDIKFDRDKIISPGLSISHLLGMFEKGAGPLSKLVEKLSTQPDKLVSLRTEILNTISQYFENNSLRQDYLLTKGTKK